MTYNDILHLARLASANFGSYDGYSRFVLFIKS